MVPFQISTVLHLMFLMIFFCFDVWSFFWYQQIISFFALSFLTTLMFHRTISWQTALCSLLLLLTEARLYAEPPLPALLFYGSAIIVLWVLKDHVYAYGLYSALAVGSLILLHKLFLAHSYSETSGGTWYTMSIIFGNILVSMLFSLILKTGKKGQSLTSP